MQAGLRLMSQELVRFNSRGVLLSRHSTVSSQVLLSLEYLGSEIWHSGFVVDRVKPAAAPGEMFHYALVIQGAEEGGFESFVYVNGEVAERYTIPLLAVDAFTLDEAQPFPWILGARLQEVGGEWVAGDRPFGGIIDELRWWSVNRSQKQIRETMNMMNLQEVPGFREQLQSWSFDDPSTSGVATGREEQARLKAPLAANRRCIHNSEAVGFAALSLQNYGCSVKFFITLAKSFGLQVEFLQRSPWDQATAAWWLIVSALTPEQRTRQL